VFSKFSFPRHFTSFSRYHHPPTPPPSFLTLHPLRRAAPLMQLLARLLKDELGKSTDLATHIIFIFFCFSNFSLFHPTLAGTNVGLRGAEVSSLGRWMGEGGRGVVHAGL